MTTTPISIDDLERIRATLDVLLRRPSRAGTTVWRADVWRAAAAAALRDLVGAASCAVLEPVRERTRRPAAATEIEFHLATEAADGAEPGMHRWRSADAVRTAESVQGFTARMAVEDGESGWLWFDFAEPRPVESLTRCFELLRMVLPAYCAGESLRRRRDRRQGALARLVELLQAGALLLDPEGRVLHANTALRRILRREAEPALLQTEVAWLARCLSARGVGGGCAERVTLTGSGSYRLHGTLPGDEDDGPATVLVMVEPLTR